MIDVLLVSFGAMLVACALTLLWTRNLVGYLLLLSAYSGLLVIILAIVGAVDVALTEAFVGAGVSGVLLIALLRRIEVEPRSRDLHVGSRAWLPALGALVLLTFLTASVSTLPPFAGSDFGARGRLTTDYVERAVPDSDTPNAVTAILADYRSLDTLVETAVIATAALTCALVVRKDP